MHKQLLKTEALVDHRNGDGLDNQRHNLRPATNQENFCNSKLRKDSTSGYKGVAWKKVRRKWSAKITKNYVQIFLGEFKNPIDAAVAYDQAATRHFGAFAKLNFYYDPACYI